MGYNYKTTDPTDTDFIMSSPTTLMQQGLQQTSDQDDQQAKTLDLFGNAVVNVHHLPGQEDEVKAIQDGYQKQIDAITNQISSDPVNYQKRMGAIRNLQRDLSTNLQSGALAYYNNTADQNTALASAAQQQLVGKDGKPGNVTPDQVQKYNAYRIADYNQRVQANGGKAYDPATGVGVPLSGEALYATPNIPQKVKDITDNFKANSSEWSRPSTGGDYIFTGKHSDEGVEAARIADAVKNGLMTDPEFSGYTEQGSRMGYVQGMYQPHGAKDQNGNDISGQPINPYTIDSNGNPVMTNGSYLGRIIQGAIDKSAYKKVVNDTEGLTANEFHVKSYESRLKLANDETMAKIDDAYKSTDEQRAAALKDEADKSQAAWKFAVGNNTSYKAVMDRVLGNGSANIQASPDGVTTVSPFAGLDKNPDGTPKPVTSTAVNAVLLPASQARMTDLISKMKDPAITDNQRALYQQQYTNEVANHDFLSDAAEKASTYAMGNLIKNKQFTANDLNNYYSYQRPEVQAAFKQQSDELNKQLTSLLNPEYETAINRGGKGGIGNIPMYTDATKAKELLTHIQNISNQTDKFDKIGKTLNDKTAEWFQQNAAPSNQRLNGIGLSVPNKQIIYDQLKTNPDVDIRNTNLDNSPGSLADKAKTILQNIAKSGENISDYFDIEKINPPVNGVGVTATVRLKNPMEDKGNFVGNAWRGLTGENVAGKNINTSDFGKDLIMSLPSSVLNAVGSNMKLNGATDAEKNMGDLITNKAQSDLLGSLKHRFVTQTPEGHTGPVGTASYFDPTTKQQLGITLVPHTIPGNPSMTTYGVYVKDATGNNHLFTTPDNPTGEFASEEDATQKLLGITPKK